MWLRHGGRSPQKARARREILKEYSVYNGRNDEVNLLTRFFSKFTKIFSINAY